MRQRKPGDYVVNAELTDEQRERFVKDCVAAGAKEVHWNHDSFAIKYYSECSLVGAENPGFAQKGGRDCTHEYKDNAMAQPQLMRQIADAMERNPDGWWREFEFYSCTQGWLLCDSSDEVFNFLSVGCLRPKPRTYTLHVEDMPEPMREEPKYGSDYWTPSLMEESNMAWLHEWEGKVIDYDRLRSGVCYPDKESAQQAMDKLKAAMGVRDE